MDSSMDHWIKRMLRKQWQETGWTDKGKESLTFHPREKQHHPSHLTHGLMSQLFQVSPKSKKVYSSCLTNSERWSCMIQPSFSCVLSLSSWQHDDMTTALHPSGEKTCPYDLWRTNRWALTRIKLRGSSDHFFGKWCVVILLFISFIPIKCTESKDID